MKRGFGLKRFWHVFSLSLGFSGGLIRWGAGGVAPKGGLELGSAQVVA